MQTATINAGDRIRLVVLDVDFGNGISTRVTRRYSWTGANPEHACNADVCETCTHEAAAGRSPTRRWPAS